MRLPYVLILLLGFPWPAVPERASFQSALERFQKETSLIAQELRNIPIDKEEPIELTARKLIQRVETLKFTPSRSPDLLPVLDHLQDLFREFPHREYCRSYPRSMVKAIARQLDFSSQQAQTAQELPKRLIEGLILPVEPERLFPINLSLEKFKELGPIIIFLLKHRTSLPESYQPIDPIEMAKGRYSVEQGVVLEGLVKNLYRVKADGDIVFDVSLIHCEITPYGQIIRRILKPKNGDRVRVYGWSYYDIFHEDESPEEKELTRGRPTVWEIHPIVKIEILDNSSQ